MDTIHTLNQDKIENLYQWYSYIDEVQNYISNRVIAWDYNSRHIRFPNGAFFIKDFDYNVGYTIKNNAQNQTYVYVFMMNLKTLKPQKITSKITSRSKCLMAAMG